MIIKQNYMSLKQLIRQKMYERIIAVVRQHYVSFIPVVLLLIALALMPFGAYFLLNAIVSNLLTDPIYYPILVLSGSIYYLSICLFFYGYFASFYLNIMIITNDRLVYINQKTIFSRVITEIDLYQIQDVTSDVSGFFHSVFNYGDISIQTAGTIPRIIMPNVPDPNNLRQQILDLANEDKKIHGTT